MGMWTGARIEELCSLKVSDVKGDWFEITDAKTDAGCRKVPIHSKLKLEIKRMIDGRCDGFVIKGLTENKYGDRSNAVGKRFGRLKADMSFDGRYVFHSIRKTVTTILDNAGVPENTTADLVGHDKPSMTYGRYSDGSFLRTLKEAVELLTYA